MKTYKRDWLMIILETNENDKSAQEFIEDIN